MFYDKGSSVSTVSISAFSSFIHFGKQMDKTSIFFFEMSKVASFIVIQLCYNELLPFLH